jgi:hypothetical protein
MFDLIRNTKPEIILSISDEYLDSCGNDMPARFVDLTWQWHDDKGNWASLEVLGAIDDAPDGNFDVATLEYDFTDARGYFSDDDLTEDDETDLKELMVHHACNFNPLHDGYIAE